MKKIIFVILFFTVVIFGIDTFHNETDKWGDFEAIYCYSQSIWTSTPVEETCAGTMNAKDTIPNGLPYSVLMILLFKLFNLMPYWVAGYIWVLIKTFCLVYILWTVSKLVKDTISNNMTLILLAFISFGGFYLSNMGQSVTFIVALFMAGIDALINRKYKTFAMFVLLSASWKYYPVWALILLFVDKKYKIFFISCLIFVAFFIGQAFIYPAGTAMLIKFGGFYNNHYAIRYAVIAVLFISWLFCRALGMRRDLCLLVFASAITFMMIGHKNEYNLIWLTVPLVLLLPALNDFKIWVILALMITQHKGLHIPVDYHLYFVAWAIVAYICLLPIFRRGDKTEMVIRL